MGMSHDRINLWLGSVIIEPESSSSNAATTPVSGQQSQRRGLDSANTRKKKLKTSVLPSPPASLKRPPTDDNRVEMPPQQTPKRRRLNKDVIDTERTPRQGDSVSITGSDIPSLPSRSDSVVSGQTSPSRLTDQLQNDSRGVEVKTMDVDDDDLPFSLAEFVQHMERVGSGRGVVPVHLEPDISRLTQMIRSLRSFEPYVYSSPSTETDRQTSTGETNIMADVLRIVDKSKESLNLRQDEAGWNNLVHTPLLDLALYGRHPWGKQLAGFCPCMTAGIMPSYRIDNIPGKKIDYSLFIDPRCDPDALPFVEALCQDRRSVNHTDFAPLKKRPVTIAIETKRPDENPQRANIQMGVWQAAQWRILEHMAGSATLESLEFLPGLLVFGHQWRFVATSYKHGKTTLWVERTIGSTQTALGVFQILAGISHLRTWSVDIFWPWYKLHVLKIGAEAEQGDEAEAEVEADMQGLAVEEQVYG